MSVRRLLLLFAAFTSALLLGAVPASAGLYPPKAPTVGTDKGSYIVGSSVTITANGFASCSNGVVTFTITPPGGGTPIVVTAPVAANGSATVTIAAPPALGTYIVIASCGDITASTTFIVSRIPVTGSNVDVPLRAGAMLVLLGGGLFVVARRRRRPAAAVA